MLPPQPDFLLIAHLNLTSLSSCIIQVSTHGEEYSRGDADLKWQPAATATGVKLDLT